MSPATVAHWIDQGHLLGHRTPTGRRRVGAEDLVAFLRAHRMPVPSDLWAAADAAGMRGVIVVEDDASYRRMLVRYLRRADLGIEVREAATGVDGLLEIGRTSPAVILLDYGLPDLNAAQVIERLLAPGAGLGAEVLVVTTTRSHSIMRSRLSIAPAGASREIQIETARRGVQGPHAAWPHEVRSPGASESRPIRLCAEP